MSWRPNQGIWPGQVIFWFGLHGTIFISKGNFGIKIGPLPGFWPPKAAKIHTFVPFCPRIRSGKRDTTCRVTDLRSDHSDHKNGQVKAIFGGLVKIRFLAGVGQKSGLADFWVGEGGQNWPSRLEFWHRDGSGLSPRP